MACVSVCAGLSWFPCSRGLVAGYGAVGAGRGLFPAALGAGAGRWRGLWAPGGAHRCSWLSHRWACLTVRGFQPSRHRGHLLPPFSSSSSWRESRTRAVWVLPSPRRSHADSPCAVSRITGIQGEAADRASMSSVIDTVFSLSSSPLPSLGETKLALMAEHHRLGSAGGGYFTGCERPMSPFYGVSDATPAGQVPAQGSAHEIEHAERHIPQE